MSSIRFKNLVVYQFTQPFKLNGIQLEEKLQEKRFRPCGSQDFSTYGWVPALGRRATALVHEAAGALLVCAMREEKILPASVINDALDEKIEQIEQEQDRQVFSKERRALKDDVVMELLPKAFTKEKATLAYIDTTNGWIVVNAASFRQSEELTSCLRECLGSLPIISVPLKNMPSFIMTSWLSNKDLPIAFKLGDDCKLREPGDEGGSVTAKKENLMSYAIGEHLAEGKIVSQLALDWKETISFKLGDDFRMTALKFSEEYISKLDDIEADTLQQQLDADFHLMVGAFRPLLDDVISGLGGLGE
ncbi:recombination-associated protein RdgC [uncultured Endozoicomonas sp.]|uniref:recombination-associated protein RdgC n=1 Tax=uncultured Endozoicomonas sp. TaxID=432652 RepID=UPI00262CE4A4|nr:recombination-associated protein RdgC [uncultured Endozoicomonas sp.]